MRKLRFAIGVVAALAAYPSLASAHHPLPEEAAELLPDQPVLPGSHASPGDHHSGNMRLVGNFDDGGDYRLGADEAFWRDTAVLSSYDEPGGFRLVDISRPRKPTEISTFECPGPQNDVSVWRRLVFVSVDSPRASPECGADGAATADTLVGSRQASWEGIRIVSIANRQKPRQVKAVYTDCGSHTHTLLPDKENNRVFIYVESYPLASGLGARCNAASHGKISVIEVPLRRPREARVVSTPNVRPAVGCHDLTVDLKTDLAAAACITESQIWDVSNPAHPKVLSRIVNPAINIHHSTTFSWDGNTAAIGDELGGAAASPGCPGGDEHMPLGSIWFYDISDPTDPAPAGTFRIPQQQADSIFCTAHNFNTVPLRSGRDVLVTGWYNGGSTVVDFTDPTDPKQLAHYIANSPTENSEGSVRSAAWSSYWYNGFVYANNFDEDANSLSPVSRGLDVFKVRHPVLKKAVDVRYLNAQTMKRFRGQRGG